MKNIVFCELILYTVIKLIYNHMVWIWQEKSLIIKSNKNDVGLLVEQQLDKITQAWENFN